MAHASPFLALALLLATAASPPPPPGGGGPAPLFIAPSGEPFRAEGGAGDPVARWFRAADADGDGRLTRAEFLADAGRWFRTLDTDGSGLLEAGEIDAYEADVLAPLNRRQLRPGGGGGERGAGAPPRGPGGGAGGGPNGGGGRRGGGPEMAVGAGQHGLINSPHPVKAADRDMNSRVTAEEWTRTLSDRFRMLGVARTGHLLLETLPRTPAQLQAERGERRGG